MGLTQRVTEAARVSRLQNGPVRLLTVGTVEPRKGLPGLIAALKALRDEPWQLDVVGALDEDHAAHLRRLIHHAGLSDRVRFHGRVSDEELNALLAKADIYVSPSRWEGFGLAVLEAMAAELPVVAIAAGAVPELIDDGRTGVLVPPDDTAALARAVRGLMADPEARAALGRRAGQEARARFNWKGTARMLDEALDALDSGLSRRPC
jgi:glycosyltransferase involved in cell wall biosynthesis